MDSRVTNEQSEASSTDGSDGPRESRIDFSNYSLPQLRDFESSIDRAAHPENYRALLDEIGRRLQAPSLVAPSVSRYDVTFTAHEGLQGWLEAKSNRLTVYGQGYIDVTDDEVVIGGLHRTWLGLQGPIQLNVELQHIRNVALEGRWLRFEVMRPWLPSRRIELSARTEGDARALAASLPQQRSENFDARWIELRAFHRQLDALNRRSWITAAIMMVNVLMFIAMAATARRVEAFGPEVLLRFGANYGPAAVQGDWWRFVTAFFVHFDLIHLSLNLWALWGVGRFTERFFGGGKYFLLYFGAGVAGNIVSVLWNPSGVAAGASGAIFGIIGAYLALLVDRSTRIPSAITRFHLLSTLAFVVLTIVLGILQDHVDNAAHFGGLVFGFFFGCLLSTPLATARTMTIKNWLALPLAVVVASGGAWALTQFRDNLPPAERYSFLYADEAREITERMESWGIVATDAANGVISHAEWLSHLERNVLPFWKAYHAKIQRELPTIDASIRPHAELAIDGVRLNVLRVQALIDATKRQDSSDSVGMARVDKEATVAQAMLELASVRTQFGLRALALANSAQVAAVRRLFTQAEPRCLAKTAQVPMGKADDPLDGPAVRETLGCEAQRLFLNRDYASLDEQMQAYASNLGDLPDGSSSLSGWFGGFRDFIKENGFNWDGAFARTAEWRRAIPHSVAPDLVEAQLLHDWAWVARGHGNADSVSPQGWQYFKFRSEMASVALAGAADRGKNYATWHELSLDVGLNLSLGAERLLGTFAEAVERFPTYIPIYQRMLRVLQPRWSGSDEEVDAFIEQASDASGASPNLELYARLYWVYSSLEDDEVEMFGDDRADWLLMKLGFQSLRERYPSSNVLLNAYAKFACMAGDARDFESVRDLLEPRPSAAAWSEEVSLASCDEKFGDADVSPISPLDHALARATEDYAQRNWSQLSVNAKQIIELDPDSARGHVMAGAAQLELGQPALAVDHFENAVRVQPELADAWYSLGRARMQSRAFEEAIQAFDRAIVLDSSHWESWADRAVAHDQLGHTAEALRDSEHACRNGSELGCNLARYLATP